MRGEDQQQAAIFSYVTLEQRIPADHPLRTVRSERLLMEQLDYDLLFRWFVGLSMDERVWNVNTFSKSRERLLDQEIAQFFLLHVVAQARTQGLLSNEHFTVDGTLPHAWASFKSMRPKDETPADRPPPDDPDSPSVDFHGEPRRNATHQSTTDPAARSRQLGVTPHVAQNTTNRRSAIDARTTRHAGYAVSQRRRQRVEEVFGWMKTMGLLRQMRHRGQPRVRRQFLFTTAVYNLVRMRNLAAAGP